VDGEFIRPLIHFEAPKPLTLKLFAKKALEAAGYPISQRRILENALFEVLKTVIKQRGILFMFVDEMQHVMKGNSTAEIQNIADTIKSLLQIEGWPLHLIFAGVPSLATFLEHETQLRNRSLVVEMKELRLPADVARVRLIAKGVIENHAGLTFHGDLSDEFIHQVIRASQGAFGSMIQVVRSSCEQALRAGKTTVDASDFAEAYALFSGCRSQHNIFTAPNWLDINAANPLSELIAKQERADNLVAVATKNKNGRRK
jgi:hypothetical protein